MKSAIETRKTRAIFLATHSRVALLEDSIKSVLGADMRSDFYFFIIHQGENAQTSEVLDYFRTEIDEIIKVKGVPNNPLLNINLNRISGYEYAFDKLECTYAVAIEDDVMVARDSLVFIDEMIQLNSRHNRLGCVNLISLGSESNSLGGYSKYRSALVGQGSAITRKSWEKIKKKRIEKRIISEPFDGAIEDLMKCKLSIFPNRSRILDRGWDGTHPSSQEDLYFKNNRRSWIGEISYKGKYKYFQEDLGLRSDWKKYRRSDDFYYLVRKYVLELNRTKIGNKVIGLARVICGLQPIPK